MRDELRWETEHFLRQLSHGVARAQQHLDDGAGRFVDEDGKTAEQRWGDWGLVIVRPAEQALLGLDQPFRLVKLNDEERHKVETLRPLVAALRVRFTEAGGHLLPGDLPPL